MMIERSALTRAVPEGPIAVPLCMLTTRQRLILEAVEAYQQATGEPCSANLLARRLRVHHSTIQEHLLTLYRKGWLRSAHAPAGLRRPIHESTPHI